MSRVTTERICPIASFESELKSARQSERDQRNLTMEHYKVKWTIECLREVLTMPEFQLTSPAFVLDSSRTEWCIDMHFSQDYACFSLRRPERLLHMPRVDLACKFGTSKTLGDGFVTWLKAVNETREVDIGLPCKVPFDTSEREAFLQNIDDYRDRFTVTCEMYVTYEIPHYDDSLLTPEDYGLISFAFDFSQLINSSESADYSVMTSVNCEPIRVHRAILAARSRFLEGTMKKRKWKTEVRLDDVSLENVLAVLNYMYSGNLSKTLTLSRRPSIGFYECARKLGVSGLETFLSPKVVQMRSALNLRPIQLMWYVHNFSYRVKHSFADPAIVVSPEFCFDSERWVLVMSLSKRQDVLSICAKVHGETNSIHSILEISLVNRNKELVHTKMVQNLGRLNMIFGVPDFLENFSVHDRDEGLVVGDTFQMQCRLQFIVSSDFVENHSFSARGNEHVLECYRELSTDIKFLASKVELSDVELIPSPQIVSYPVHKPVFFARFRDFGSKFPHHNRDDPFIEFPDVTQNVLFLMIRYAYRGKMDPPAPVEELISLCRAAMRYGFRGLEIFTLYHLASRLSVTSFVQLYAESQALPSNYLEAKCEAYAHENLRAIMEEASWNELEPELQKMLINRCAR